MGCSGLVSGTVPCRGGRNSPHVLVVLMMLLSLLLLPSKKSIVHVTVTRFGRVFLFCGSLYVVGEQEQEPYLCKPGSGLLTGSFGFF